MLFYTSFVNIIQAKLGQASARDNEVKLLMKHTPELVRTSEPARCLWVLFLNEPIIEVLG